MRLPSAVILLAAVPGFLGIVYKIEQYSKRATGSLGLVPTGTRSWVSGGKTDVRTLTTALLHCIDSSINISGRPSRAGLFLALKETLSERPSDDFSWLLVFNAMWGKRLYPDSGNLQSQLDFIL